MRNLLIAILPLLVFGCASHDAGSALKIMGRSEAAQAQLWTTVDSVVGSFARERGFRLIHDSHGSSAKPRFKTYVIEPPNQPVGASIVVFCSPENVKPDNVTIDISEAGVSRPSRKHLEIQRALKARLEAAGLVVSPTEPSLIVVS